MNKKSIKTLLQFFTSDVAKCLSLCAVIVLAMGASNAFAAAAVGTGLCSVPNAVLNGNIGRAIATLGIIIIGIGATLGRVTWTQAIIVGVGISVIFGAVAISSMFGATGTC